MPQDARASQSSASLEIFLPSGQSTRIPVDPLPFHIGRGADNHLILRDNRASRTHARISVENGLFSIEDLESRHGTWLNGARAEGSVALKHGDSIHFGFDESYRLVFSRGTTNINRILDQLSSAGEEAGAPRSLSKLRALMEVARALQTSLSTKDVLGAVVDAALAVTGCERGFLLLHDGDSLDVAVARDAFGTPLAITDLQVPTSLIHRALHDRRELLSMTFNPLMGGESSSSKLELRSVVCVPLVQLRSQSSQETLALTSANDTVGLLYMDSREANADLSAGNRELLQSLALEVSTVLENARLMEEEKRKHLLEEELSIAREIQCSLLPRELPSGGWFRAAASSLPSFEVAGDHFDVRQTGADSWSIVVADVSGKGVSSALLAALLQGAFLMASELAMPLDAMMARINTFLHDRSQGEKYATLFYATVQRSGELQWANAGHCEPVVLKPNGHMRRLRTTGMPLGLLPGAHYDLETAQLEPGDKIVAYSDGLTEAENGRHEAFEPQLLPTLLKAASLGAQGVHDALVEALQGFAGNTTIKDDVTVLVAEMGTA